MYQLIPYTFHVSQRPGAELRRAMALLCLITLPVSQNCSAKPVNVLSGYSLKLSLDMPSEIPLENMLDLYRLSRRKLLEAIHFGTSRPTKCQQICSGVQKGHFPEKP